MLTAELDAIASWQNGVRLQGLVRLNYLSDVDPWLVHMTFVVADARDDIEIERTHLFNVAGKEKREEWLFVPGAPFRLAVGEHFVRMRLTEPDSGTYCDFDVKREEMKAFLGKTAKAITYTEEQAALQKYIDDGLEGLL